MCMCIYSSIKLYICVYINMYSIYTYLHINVSNKKEIAFKNQKNLCHPNKFNF